MAKSPLGKLAPGAIGMLELPRLAAQILDGFRALGELTGTTSDALDECRIAGAVPGSILRPTDPKARLVAQALTVFNRKLEVLSKTSGLGEIEAHNLAEPGDALVIQGVAGISSMGGVSAAAGKRQGEAGGDRRRRGARYRPLAQDRLSSVVIERQSDHRQMAHRNRGGEQTCQHCRHRSEAG